MISIFNSLVKELFSAEKDVVDPLNNGFPLIQFNELLQYIMKARDILGIEYKCRNCYPEKLKLFSQF